MTYLRVICVAAIASVLAAIVSGHGGSHPPGGAWCPALDALGLAETAAIGAAGDRDRQPASNAGRGDARPNAPRARAWNRPDLSIPNCLVGFWHRPICWSDGGIGLGFTPEIVRTAARAAPRGWSRAIGALILFCAGCGLVLARLAGKDLLTAYLAMSPGGADSRRDHRERDPCRRSFCHVDAGAALRCGSAGRTGSRPHRRTPAARDRSGRHARLARQLARWRFQDVKSRDPVHRYLRTI